MTSNQQIRSNERNTELATDPQDLQRQDRSSRGFRANRMPSEHIVVPGEDPADVDKLIAKFDERLRPTDIFEDSLVQHMMRNEWRCRRASRVEAYLLYDRTQDHSAKLADLTRYRTRLRRISRQCLKVLSDYRVTQVRAPHLIDGGIPTATITTQRPPIRRSRNLLI